MVKITIFTTPLHTPGTAVDVVSRAGSGGSYKVIRGYTYSKLKHTCYLALPVPV